MVPSLGTMIKDGGDWDVILDERRVGFEFPTGVTLAMIVSAVYPIVKQKTLTGRLDDFVEVMTYDPQRKLVSFRSSEDPDFKK